MAGNNRRPVNRDLTTIRFSVSTLLSVFQQIGGVVLFLLLPGVLWLFQSSLASPESFAALSELAGNPLVKVLALILLWLFMHHLCAGLRSMFLEVFKSSGKRVARLSSKLAMAAGVLLTLLVGVPWLW